jgi:tRNA A37 threonylcarbamoyladenosine modification protein TsaB
MSYSLFVDSSEYLTIGLLDKDLNWAEFKTYKNKKSSGVFHGLLEEILTKYELDLFKLERVFYCAGPGSYTGVRLVEGFAQILRWKKIKTNSFYFFDVPKFLNYKKGQWISEAHKGEFFVYSWDEKKSESNLVAKSEFKLQGEVVFTISSSIEIIPKSLSTLKLIEDNPVELFSKIIEDDLSETPYYYREIDKEFTKPRQVKGL